MSTVNNYVGRSTDLCVLQGATQQGMATLTPALDNLICTGAQKLAQMAAITFLAEKGSDQFDPERGTEFITAARLGAINTENDVAVEFSMAAAEVVRQLAVRQPANAHPEEVLVSMTLLSFSLVAGDLKLRAQLTTRAWPNRTVILPISVPLGR